MTLIFFNSWVTNSIFYTRFEKEVRKLINRKSLSLNKELYLIRIVGFIYRNEIYSRIL